MIICKRSAAQKFVRSSYFFRWGNLWWPRHQPGPGGKYCTRHFATPTADLILPTGVGQNRTLQNMSGEDTSGPTTTTTTSTQSTKAMESSSDVLLADNPCWGSPRKCDLKYLLSQFSKSELIVYESDHYIVLNKPPDLRMDGPYPATVHKLLTYLYPPPSLQPGLPENDSSSSSSSSSGLLQTISKLHQHNSLGDNSLRPCHQLDYATSGLLCVARTKQSAAHAIRQWEQRNVTKEYLAILEGSIASPTASLPVFSPTDIRSVLERLEQRYKKTRRPKSTRKATTFQGFQPPHALFQKYKSTITKQASDPGTAKMKSRKKRPRPETLTSDQWTTIWKPVELALIHDAAETQEHATKTMSEDRRTLLQGMEWKSLCRTRPEWKRAFQEAANIHNDILRQALWKEEQGEYDNLTLPTIFGERDEASGKSVSNVYYIYCPLGQGSDTTDFSMKVPPDSKFLKENPHMKPFVGPPGLDYKPGLTKCTILSSIDNNNNLTNTTKVQLLPLTGRRHQLRVHMALLMGEGYGIAGDITYNRYAAKTAERGGPKEGLYNSGATLQSSTYVSMERMCLHSHKLSLRLLGDEGKEENSLDKLVHLEAPDPFH